MEIFSEEKKYLKNYFQKGMIRIFFSEGDEQREVDQNKAHVLKIFEHIGKQI